MRRREFFGILLAAPVALIPRPQKKWYSFWIAGGICYNLDTVEGRLAALRAMGPPQGLDGYWRHVLKRWKG